ncbi:MAG: shikimate dehydrogenase [Verrucomicrobiota bacterium]|nr:shikimate dehydrogenase [Verrucomicrobiota bacterium]
MPETAQPIAASTRYCAVYGHPVRHSASPPMQNAGLSALGLDWRYLACEVRPEELEEAITGARAMHFIGLNLTVPHKLLALEMMDVLDESAREWGAVNTVRFEGREVGGEWQPLHALDAAPSELRSHGFNTDADAITQSLREDLGMEVRGESVLLLGAGGAGRVAALKLAASGAKTLHLVNRTMAKAEALAAEVSERFPGVTVAVGLPEAEVDLVLNATSLGLKAGDPQPGEGFALERARAVFDMIYRPAETPLLAMARAAGCRAANGMGMLLHQGAKALEIWSGQAAPLEAMRTALKEALDA